MSEFVFSGSPHIKSGNTTRKIMLEVLIALLPATIVGIVYFGLFAFLTVLVSVLSAILAELVYELISGKSFKQFFRETDYSSAVTGVILALIIPANYHLYIPALSAIFAVIVVKMLFGGTGKNLVNPAATGRIFAFISFTTILNAFPTPSVSAIKDNIITGASSLQSFLADGSSLSVIDLILGTGVAGAIGETCKIAILVGAIYLAIRGIINIILPIIALVFAGLTAFLLQGCDFSVILPAVLSGGLFFCAFFMATDFVTNPMTFKGNLVFFILFGVLTSLLRHYTGYETASFALLLVNLLVPLIDKATPNKPFGYKKPKKGAK